jgi:hypothetical protein
MKTEYKTSENKRKNAINYYYNHKEEIKKKNYMNRFKISKYFKEYYIMNKEKLNNRYNKKEKLNKDKKNKITKITNIPNSNIVIFE